MKKLEGMLGIYLIICMWTPMFWMLNTLMDRYHMHSFNFNSLTAVDQITFIVICVLSLSLTVYFIKLTSEYKDGLNNPPDFESPQSYIDDNETSINRAGDFIILLEERITDRNHQMETYKDKNLRLYDIMKTERAELETILGLFKKTLHI